MVSGELFNVLDRGNEPVLDLLTFYSAPVGAFEVMQAGLGKTVFTQVSAPSAVTMSFGTGRLGAGCFNKVLIIVAHYQRPCKTDPLTPVRN